VGKWWRLAALVTALAVAAALRPDVTQVPEWVRAAGVAGPLLYLGCYVAGVLVFVPRPALTLAGGLLFGAVFGAALAVAGATLAALAGFLLARAAAPDVRLARSRVGWLRRFDGLLGRRGWLAVAYLRLLPVVPFAAVNYGCALTSLRAGQFALGTAVGSIPGTVLLAMAGRSLTDPASATFVVPAIAAFVLGVLGFVVARFVFRDGDEAGARRVRQR
jgi:uncharacterized membrane protein YdjX (TVP38/TMEM64 family)